MKSLICAILIFSVLILGGVIFTNKITQTSTELNVIQSDVARDVEYDDYENATKKLYNLETIIMDNRVLFGSMLDHNEIDNIEASISKIKIYIKTMNKAEALAHLENLSKQLEHLYRNFKITIENIL